MTERLQSERWRALEHEEGKRLRDLAYKLRVARTGAWDHPDRIATALTMVLEVETELLAVAIVKQGTP